MKKGKKCLNEFKVIKDLGIFGKGRGYSDAVHIK